MNIKRFIDMILDGRKKRRTILLTFDILCYLVISAFYYFVALRAANSMPVDNLPAFLTNAVLQLALILVFRFAVGTYHNVWRYSNTRAYVNLVLADTCGSLATLLLLRLAHIFVYGIYRGVWQAVSVGALTALLTLFSRFIYTLVYKAATRNRDARPRVPVVIVGAGRLGTYLSGDLCNNPNSGYEPVFFVDNDRTKVRNMVSGLKVYDAHTAEYLIGKLGIREVIIAITNKDGEEMSKLYNHYRQLGCRVRVYDSLVSDSATPKGVLREFSIEDLLLRKPLEVTSEAATAYYSGKTVLITGGGGSIGSELCRQIAACGPKKLIIFDFYENNAYDIQQELIRTYGDKLDLETVIGSVRDPAALDALFSQFRPEVVFHAAAHKHVPLMENCGAEAIINNCVGTCNTADMAEKYGVEKFILISSDKAVNPTNIMGATKRICEMIIQCRTDSATSFAAVRFGNVLGSNGSVIPLFKKQIAAGGPVTLTDKRIIRYFMTIPEASQLVIHAGAMAKKGELFVLDMGKPVRIYDLAANMIRLSGLEPNEDIEIREIGLRPGEKLFEELLMQTEQLDKTENDMIFIERDTPYTRREVDEKMRILLDAVKARTGIREAVAAVVPTFLTPEQANRNAENSNEMKLLEKVM